MRASDRHLAELLAATPEAKRADEAALVAALAADYGKRTDPKPNQRPAGRSLSANALYDTGVAGWLVGGAHDDATMEAVTEGLVEFLAGPAVPTWRYLGLDADVTLADGPVAVAGWELVVHDADALRALLPVPAAAGFASRTPWNPNTWAGCAFLRRIGADATPVMGLVIYFPEPYPERVAWQPVLVLSCWTNDVVTVWSDHVIEPARYVGMRLDRVWYDVIGGEDWEVERPMTASLGLNPVREAMFRRFCAELDPLLPDPEGTSWRPATLRRAAHRFLAAGEHAAVTPEPFHSAHVPDAVFDYVAAVEGLLVPDANLGEVARKVSQRTAVLAGRNADDRLEIGTTMSRAYKARSRWAHGDQLDDKHRPDVSVLRDLARRVVVAWIVVSEGCKNPEELAARCDAALLSQAALSDLRGPVDSMRERVLGT